MIIQPTSLAALTWAGAAAGTTAPSWRIGSVLEARPLGVNPSGMLVLQIGAMTVETALIDVPLPAEFQVRVLSAGVQPQLEALLARPSTGDPVVQQFLRERLPQQNGYSPLLATLGALSQRSMLRQLPPDIRTALALLDHAVHTPAELSSGEGLRKAMLESGLFFESQLAQTDGRQALQANDDWKGALLRLLVALDQRGSSGHPSARGDTAPPLLQRGLQNQPRQPLPLAAEMEDLGSLLDRLHGDVKAALARLEVAQLESTRVPAWMIEIPLRGEEGHDVLQLQLAFVEENSETGRGWNLGFALDLPSLGSVQGEMQLREPRLSVRMWAERADTAQKLERQFTPLRQRLAACGLLLDQLSCQVGLPQADGRRSAVLLQATA